MSVTLILVLVAFGAAVLNAIGKCPLWVSVIVICVILMLGVLPR